MRPCSVSHLLLNYTALAIDLLSDAEPPVVNVQLVNVEQYTINYQDEDDQFTPENLVWGLLRNLSHNAARGGWSYL